MDESTASENLILELREYASLRQRDVARGAESPRLAALLVQKFGLGLSKAVERIYGSPRAADPINSAVDVCVAQIDPNWREHARERWNGRPADVVGAPAGDGP